MKGITASKGTRLDYAENVVRKMCQKKFSDTQHEFPELFSEKPLHEAIIRLKRTE